MLMNGIHIHKIEWEFEIKVYNDKNQDYVL